MPRFDLYWKSPTEAVATLTIFFVCVAALSVPCTPNLVDPVVRRPKSMANEFARRDWCAGSKHAPYKQKGIVPPSSHNSMGSLRVLDLVKPFGAFLPEIISPERKPTFQTRITWTGRLTADIVMILC